MGVDHWTLMLYGYVFDKDVFYEKVHKLFMAGQLQAKPDDPQMPLWAFLESLDEEELYLEDLFVSDVHIHESDFDPYGCLKEAERSHEIFVYPSSGCIKGEGRYRSKIVDATSFKEDPAVTQELRDLGLLDSAKFPDSKVILTSFLS